MLFNSIEFAIFLPIVYGLYLFMSHKGQNRMLLLASYIFYSFWDWRFLSLILISTVLDYVCDQASDMRTRRFYLLISVIGNLSILFFFKYFNFFIDNLEGIFHNFGWPWRWSFWQIVLPVGISFYTFQTLSYTIDMYRQEIKPCRDFLDYALYVAFFPQLLAGPIERAGDLIPQIQRPRKVSLKQFYIGCHFILWGLFLKIFMADNVAAIVDPIFASPAPYNGAVVLLGIYAFVAQLYGDFAGYSFVAVGVAGILGITLTHNFKRPHFSEDIGEFWQRYHITLTSWVRDYVFWPLAKYFSLKMTFKYAAFFALMISVTAFGFWHGANWNFGLFGMSHT